MSTMEKFCLKWNDFQKNISTEFVALREDNDFTDVTLACEDGHQLGAHKVILAASSPFFQNLLRRNKHAHPLIYMRGVKSEDLVAIVDFLYHGETNISQENLDNFLVIAEELQLKGLTGRNDDSDVAQDIKEPPNTNKTDQIISEAKPTQIHKIKDTNPDANYALQEYKHHDTVSQTKEGFSGDLQELDQKIKSMWTMVKRAGKSVYVCHVCGKEGSHPTQMRDHMEANHIDGVSHPCSYCNKPFRSRCSLRKHKSSQHKF